MAQEQLERHNLQRALVRRREDHRRGHARIHALEPPGGANAPAVAGLQTGKLELGPRRGEIVAQLLAPREKRGGYLHAHGVAAGVFRAGVAVAVTKEPGERGVRAWLERTTKDVARRKRNHSPQQITVAPRDARPDFEPMASIYETLRADIVTAMKARDAATTTALRTADAAIKRAAMDANKEIDDALAIATLRKAVKNLADAKAEFEKGGRADLVAANDAEIRILEKYLPQGLDAAKIDALIAEAIQETGAQSKKDMGKVIGALKKRPEASLIDFGAVSKQVQAKLP
jgi:uncharacterized protein